jgi:L-lactate dehydrogenase
VFVSWSALETFASDVLDAAGARREDAEQVAAHLVRADASGYASHGVRLLPHYADEVRGGRIDRAATIERVHDDGAVVVLDGHGGFGQVTGRAAVALAAERARTHGIACVLGRYAGDLGRLGDYTEALVELSFASLLLVTGHGSGGPIAPWGGQESRFANDALSLGFPDAVVLDMALGAAAARKIQLALERGEPIPEGWATDAQGASTTDPEEVMDRRGRILPAGGHKGYALIVLVELLVGVLSGAGLPRAGWKGEYGNAFLLIAIDAEQLVPQEEILAQVRAFHEYVTSSPPLPGLAAVSLPGERSASARRRAEVEGIDLDEPTWRALEELAAAMSLSPLLARASR